MPTVLTSGDREDVEQRLRSGPPLQQDAPLLLKTVITWVTRIITSLLNYVSYFIGIISDDVAALTKRVAELEENVPHAAPVAQPTPPTTSQQPSHPSVRTRCKRCHALGHDTMDCRSKDPVALKKRVSNNQRARKKQELTQPLATSPYYILMDPLRHIHQQYPPTSPHALQALAADAKELRRRKVQSTWDKRRKGAHPPDTI